MKRLVLSLLMLSCFAGALHSQEMNFSKEQIDSLISEAASSYEAPKFQGVPISGTIEEIAAVFTGRGWVDPFSRFSEEDLRESGLGADTRYQDGILLEGIFLGRKASLVLYPISRADRRVSYAAVTFNVQDKTVKHFVEKEVMYLVHQYEKKYGAFTITDVSEGYEAARRSTTKEQYGPSKHIITFGFEDPEILLRAQTDSEGEFAVVIHYLNTINMTIQLLLNPNPMEEI